MRGSILIFLSILINYCNSSSEKVKKEVESDEERRGGRGVEKRDKRDERDGREEKR